MENFSKYATNLQESIRHFMDNPKANLLNRMNETLLNNIQEYFKKVYPGIFPVILLFYIFFSQALLEILWAIQLRQIQDGMY
jgi:hypothetical protein